MVIRRDRYLNKLIAKRKNGLVKIITGIRRCGKSFLLFRLYREYLRREGVPDDAVIELSLDEIANARYRNPLELDAFIRSRIADKARDFYVFIDEIQMVLPIQNPYVDDKDAKLTFIDVLLGLMKIPNVDLYVTGSNSRLLSSDIMTEFRDRGDEVRLYPLTFAEVSGARADGSGSAWRDYITYGGMPLVVSMEVHEDKSRYLKDLFEKTYITDVIERNRITNDKGILEDMLNILSSSVGSLTNPTRLSDTFKSVNRVNVSAATIARYIGCLEDAFIVQKAERYDIRGRRYIGAAAKYYFTDVGLRNARLNFRQQEESHIMENVIYNELRVRGFDVDVGVVEYSRKDANRKTERVKLEVDFVANRGSQRYYVQSTLSAGDAERRARETAPLCRVPDSFKKIVVVKDDIVPWHDDSGILYVGVEKFLLDEGAIDL